METDKSKLDEFDVTLKHFDFENEQSFRSALHDIDVLFLLWPPQLADVSKFFKPLIAAAVNAGVKHIVFLSVQGVENSKIIPHHKIERLIVESNIAYTFLRPAYFMQNFTTTLNKELKQHQRIFLPAGKAKFTLIDVDDIGDVAATILIEPNEHINKSYELTNNEPLTFGEMAEKLSARLGKKIDFVSPNLVQFYFTKRKEKLPSMLIFVMIMLHYFPRFQKTPVTTKWVKIITGHEPIAFDEFIFANREKLC